MCTSLHSLLTFMSSIFGQGSGPFHGAEEQSAEVAAMQCTVPADMWRCGTNMRHKQPFGEMPNPLISPKLLFWGLMQPHHKAPRSRTSPDRMLQSDKPWSNFKYTHWNTLLKLFIAFQFTNMGSFDVWAFCTQRPLFGLAFLSTILLVAAWRINAYAKARRYKLPPRIPGSPIVGNTFQLPPLKQGVWGMEMAKKYGEM